MSGEKEFIWVPAEKAAEFKAAESENAQLAIIDNIIASTKRNMRADLEVLDEDVLQFRGMLLKYKKAYSEALQVHYDATYKIWEDIDSKIPNMKRKAEQSVAEFAVIAPELEKVSSQIDMITARIEKVNIYQLTHMVELVQAIQNTDDATKAILGKVLAAAK